MIFRLTVGVSPLTYSRPIFMAESLSPTTYTQWQGLFILMLSWVDIFMKKSQIQTQTQIHQRPHSLTESYININSNVAFSSDKIWVCDWTSKTPVNYRLRFVCNLAIQWQNDCLTVSYGNWKCILWCIYLFICDFTFSFNTVQVISRRVVGRAEETSTYSSSGFCTVNCRPTASNYQLSHCGVYKIVTRPSFSVTRWHKVNVGKWTFCHCPKVT